MSERPTRDDARGREATAPVGAETRPASSAVSRVGEFDRWWAEHDGEVRTQARRYGEYADDFVNSAYEKLRDKAETTVFDKPGALVRREIHNQWVNNWRKETGRGKRDYPEDLEVSATDGLMGEVQRAVFREKLFEFLDSADTTDVERRAFVSFYFLDLSDREIAEAEGVAGESTTRMRRQRVLKQLRQYLTARGVHAPDDLFDLD